MSKPIFNVTYDKVTEASAAQGDFAECGFISEGALLRDALSDVQGAPGECEGVDYDGNSIRIIHRPDYMENWRGEVCDYSESRTLHFPDSVRKYSRNRIASYLTAKHY